METKKENKILTLDTVAIASDKVKPIIGKEKPKDESDFVKRNTIKQVKINDNTNKRSE